MPVKGDILVYNDQGNLLEGPNEDGSSPIYEFNHHVYLPYNPETVSIERQRRGSAFTITKDLDRLSPLLYEVVCNGRRCQKVEVRLYRIHPSTGTEEHYYNVLLENVNIVKVDDSMPNTKDIANETKGHLQVVEFLARDVTWTYLDGGIEYHEHFG